jgi:hypothetical protein
MQEMEKQLLDWCVSHAKKHKIEISFMLVSAKTGQNVSEAFQVLSRRILNKRLDTYQKLASQMMSTAAGDQRSNENSGSNNSQSGGRVISIPSSTPSASSNSLENSQRQGIVLVSAPTQKAPKKEKSKCC